MRDDPETARILPSPSLLTGYRHDSNIQSSLVHTNVRYYIEAPVGTVNSYVAVPDVANANM